MSVTFQRDTTIVTLPDPSPGYPVRSIKHQAVGRTADGTLYAYDKGPETFEVVLVFESLDGSEKEALHDFFSNTAQGTLNIFTYTDSNGTQLTARFLDPQLEFVKVSANVWDVSVRLELSSLGS